MSLICLKAVYLRSSSLVASCGAVLVGLLLAGCISVQKSSLAPAEDQPTYRMNFPFVGKTSASALRHESFRTLLPGRYSPIGRNSSGVWYLGDGENFWEYIPGQKSGGKSLLISYRGGVVLSQVPGESTFVQIRSTAKSYWVGSDEEADNIILSGGGKDSAKAEGSTTGATEALRAVSAGASPIGAAVGGAIADGLLTYDAQGLFAMPQWGSTKGLEAWLKSD